MVDSRSPFCILTPVTQREPTTTDAEKIEKMEKLLKRTYDLINQGEGIAAHLEVDGFEAQDIYNEIRDMKLDA